MYGRPCVSLAGHCVLPVFFLFSNAALGDHRSCRTKFATCLELGKMQKINDKNLWGFSRYNVRRKSCVFLSSFKVTKYANFQWTPSTILDVTEFCPFRGLSVPNFNKIERNARLRNWSFDNVFSTWFQGQNHSHNLSEMKTPNLSSLGRTDACHQRFQRCFRFPIIVASLRKHNASEATRVEKSRPTFGLFAPPSVKN